MPRFVWLPILFVLIFWAGGITGAFAQAIDPHQLYEQRCGSCHTPHAGDFVHNSLVRFNARIFGRESRRELREFLASGHGKMTPDEIETMITHLTNILQSGGVFKNKCTVCHDRAVEFARRKLFIKNGELIGRYTNRNVEQFLSAHGRLETEEISKMVEVLTRQLIPPQKK